MNDLVDVTGATLDKKTNALLVQCKGAPVDEEGSEPDYGQVPAMCSLGVTAYPYRRTKEGNAQAIVVDAPGFAGVAIGMRDTRTAGVVGRMEEGDTCVHSTGPKQAALLLLKEKKSIVGLITKTIRGAKTMMFVLDGLKQIAQLTHAGAILEINKKGDISLLNGSGVGLLIQGKNVHVIGNLVAGKGNPPSYFACMNVPVSPGGIATVPLFACRGMVPGT